MQESSKKIQDTVKSAESSIVSTAIPNAQKLTEDAVNGTLGRFDDA